MAQGGLRTAAAMALVVVGACAAPAPPPAPPTRQPAPPIATAPPPAAPAPAPAPPATADACGAAALQSLIGKPHTDIPPPVYPGRRRVVCSTCVMTQDYQPYRQTIIFSSATGLVTSATCG